MYGWAASEKCRRRYFTVNDECHKAVGNGVALSGERSFGPNSKWLSNGANSHYVGLHCFI